MESDRHRDPRAQRSGSTGGRDSGAAAHERATEDREMLADAQSEAADRREFAANDREVDQDSRDRDQDQREARQDQREAQQDQRDRDQDQRELDHVADRTVSTAHLEVLTDRQREILTMIADGMSNKAVAKELFVSINTLKTTIRAIYDKIGATSRTQAVHWFTHGPRDEA